MSAARVEAESVRCLGLAGVWGLHLFWLSVALMSAARVEAESVRCLGLACIYSG